MFGYLACTADFLEEAEFAESCFEPYVIIIGKRNKNLAETRLLSSKPTNGVLKKYSYRYHISVALLDA